MIRRLHFVFVLLFIFLSGKSQIPVGYYNAAQGLTGVALKNALHTIITNGQNVGSYASLWTSYETSDVRADGKVWDIYSDVPGGTPPYFFSFVTDQCGSYSAEGDCYNREHTVPESWFAGASPMYSDLFHILPTDGYVNNRRSNYPYGKVASASWTSQNGSKLGSSAVAGYTGTVFEPVDSFKGDIARIYFYMATRYQDVISGWSGDPFSGTDLTPWAKNLLLQWDALDPVSSKEIVRNNKVYTIQHNRNPYVDHPEWVLAIWGSGSGIKEPGQEQRVNIYPNPAKDQITVRMAATANPSEIRIYRLDGSLVKLVSALADEQKIELSDMSPGLYFILVQDDKHIYTSKLAVQ